MTHHPLTAWLKEHGKSQSWLAKEAGVRKATVTGWTRRGIIPRPAQMQRVAEVTADGVPVTAWFQAGAAA